VLKQYIEKGDLCASGLNGIFHFVIYDNRSGRIKLFSDKFGLQPLYYSVFEDGIIFGGEIKALLKDNRVNKTPDYNSIADFMHYGQVLGQKTLFQDIKVLAPGSLLTYDINDFSVSLKNYFYLEKLFVEKGSYNLNTSVKDVAALLAESIKTRSSNTDILGLSLSGGLDTRGILAGLEEKSRGIRTYTLGIPGCADQKLAEKMARVAKTDHEFVELGTEYLANFENLALNMIRLSDGMYHPHESTEMLALEYFKKAKFKILLRGHGGEIAKAALAYPVMVTPPVYAFSTKQDIMSYILNITNLVMRDIDPAKLFASQFRDVMIEAPAKSLENSCGRVSERLAPADVCIYYYINEAIRRKTTASLDIFRSQVEIRMPYIDEAFINKLLQLPVKYRNEGEVHFKLIKACMPELIKIANSNTGAPMDAGPLRLFVTDKFNSIMKRFSVKGFRHYTEFQKWHREGFRESSRRIIFSDQTEGRNIYDMDYLKTIFEMHASGQKNYAHLLGTIVGLEYWFRSFMD